MHAGNTLSLIAAVSGIYDLVIGMLMLFAVDRLAVWFGTPPPQPPIHANLNGIFLIAVAIGYWLPYRDPVRYRGYLWVMGPLLKGAGAMTFVADYLARGSPRSFLLFAVSDGVLAAVTLWALLAARSPRDV